MQASLDVKYLKGRYDRGLEKVRGIMEESQRYLNFPTLQDGLPDLINYVSTRL